MRLSERVQFVVLASLVVSFLAGSSAPTPLYGVYQASWGFSPITTTAIFGVYALAVLATLLVIGSISDYVGRRPVLFAATLVQAATMLIFATAHGTAELFAARIVQGLATGSAAAAVGAAMLDLDRERGTIANAISPMLGTATGALASGLCVQYLPRPTQLVYALLGVVFVAQAIAITRMTETVTPRTGALASLRPRFRLPRDARRPLLVALPALAGAWALAGFYGSLGPSLARKISGSGSIALGGIALFVLGASGAITVYIARNRTARFLMLLGSALLVAGVALGLAAISARSLPLFFAGLVVAGAGFGASFQGSIRSVLAHANADDRAGVLSVLYVVAYVSMSVPAVIGGARVVYGDGLIASAREYGAAVMILATLALAGTIASRSKREVEPARAMLALQRK